MYRSLFWFLYKAQWKELNMYKIKIIVGALVAACKMDMGDLSYDDFSRWKVPTYNNKVLPI